MLRHLMDNRARSPWRLLLGVLCVGLVLMAGTLSAVHSHPQDEVSHTDCGLCATAHATVQAAEMVVLVAAVAVTTRIDFTENAPRPRIVVRAANFIRPPPSNA